MAQIGPPTPRISIVFNAIAFNGNKYIAVGGYGIIHSTDAVN